MFHSLSQLSTENKRLTQFIKDLAKNLEGLKDQEALSAFRVNLKSVEVGTLSPGLQKMLWELIAPIGHRLGAMREGDLPSLAKLENIIDGTWPAMLAVPTEPPAEVARELHFQETPSASARVPWVTPGTRASASAQAGGIEELDDEDDVPLSQLPSAKKPGKRGKRGPRKGKGPGGPGPVSAPPASVPAPPPSKPTNEGGGNQELDTGIRKELMEILTAAITPLAAGMEEIRERLTEVEEDRGESRAKLQLLARSEKNRAKNGRLARLETLKTRAFEGDEGLDTILLSSDEEDEREMKRERKRAGDAGELWSRKELPSRDSGHPRGYMRNRLPLNCDERLAAENLYGWLTAFESITSFVQGWEDGGKTRLTRNKHEALTLARSLYILIDELGYTAASKSKTAEVLVRRLLAIQLNNETGNWTVAGQLQENGNLQGERTRIAFHNALKLVQLQNKIASQKRPDSKDAGEE